MRILGLSAAVALLAGTLAFTAPATAQMSPERQDQIEHRDMQRPDSGNYDRAGDRDRMMSGDHRDDMVRGDRDRMRDRDRYASNDHRGWDRHHRHCRTVWRHHHQVRHCWR